MNVRRKEHVDPCVLPFEAPLTPRFSILIMYPYISDGSIITGASSAAAAETSDRLVARAFGIIGAQLACCVIYGYCFTLTQVRQTAALKLRLFRSLARLDLAWHGQRDSEALPTEIGDQLSLVHAGLSIDALRAFGEGVTIVYSFGVALYYSWDYTLCMLGLLPLLIAPAWLQSRFHSRSQPQIATMRAEAACLPRRLRVESEVGERGDGLSGNHRTSAMKRERLRNQLDAFARPNH